MELDGIQTEYTKIDIDEEDIINATISILKERNKDLIPYDYIDDEGYWQEWQYDSHHNGDPVYDQMRKATKKEKEFDNFLQKLQDFLDKK